MYFHTKTAGSILL